MALSLSCLWIRVMSLASSLISSFLFAIHYLFFIFESFDHWHSKRYYRNIKPDTLSNDSKLVKRPFSKNSLKKWRLLCQKGRQRWVPKDELCAYRPSDGVRIQIPEQSFAQEYMLQEYRESQGWKGPLCKPRNSSKEAVSDAVSFLVKLQEIDGHWLNEHVGPIFFTTGLIYVKYIIYEGNLKKMFKFEDQRVEILRYLTNKQNDDGGWGIYPDAHSSMLGTVLSYVALRLIGEPVDSKLSLTARLWITSHGGAVRIPSLGKYWLSVMNLFSYDGCEALLPEVIVWLYPQWFLLSLGRYSCPSRTTTLPFSYLYGKRFQTSLDALLSNIRTEIYNQQYSTINWSSHRKDVTEDGIYTPPHYIYNYVICPLFHLYERFHSKYVRREALKEACKQMEYDDINIYDCLEPMDKMLHVLVTYINEGVDSDAFRQHEDYIEDYLWLGCDGMHMSANSSSQLHDTSLAVQGIFAADMQHAHSKVIEFGHEYIAIEKETYRSSSKGSWCFNTHIQDWQVSDWTSEGLKVVLMVLSTPKLSHRCSFPTGRIYDSVDEILELRHRGLGGWATYDASIVAEYTDILNTIGICRDAMLKKVYCGLTASCIHSLCLFRIHFPTYRVEEVTRAISEGVACLKSMQRADGSFHGGIGVCYTYTGYLVSNALTQAEDSDSSCVFRRLSCFTISKRNTDGGWGEDYSGSIIMKYAHSAEGSQVVCTCWAVMTLIYCNYTSTDKYIIDIIDTGIRFIMHKQLPSGDWPKERIGVILDEKCATYNPSFRLCMPIIALGVYNRWVKDREDKKL